MNEMFEITGSSKNSRPNTHKKEGKGKKISEQVNECD